jgi:glucose/arabinose dehydrogenase
MKRPLFAIFAIASIAAASAPSLPLDKIKLPPGFKISIYAFDVQGARSMALGKNGTLFIGTRDLGKVYAITPDGKVRTIASGLDMSNGVAFKNGALYVAEVGRIFKFDNIEESLDQPPKAQVFNRSYPLGKDHGWKFIAFGPDGKLYVPIGAPCNECEVKPPYASITRLDVKGKRRQIFARGVRNTEGFDWHPVTHELWFTDNGRDMLGDDVPPDELNRAPRAGMHFGFPYCHGVNILDPELGKGKKCSNYTAPEQKLAPHVEALGMRFYTGSMFPAEYKNQIFIAEHGSWNRTTPIGYRVALVKLSSKGKPVSYQPFAEGWLQDRKPWGRPVDVLVAPDGALLVSDDFAGVIYRISYQR